METKRNDKKYFLLYGYKCFLLLNLWKNYPKISMKILRSIAIVVVLLFCAGNSNAQLRVDSIRLKPLYALQPLKSNYYCSNLGFFCKQELKLDKITVMPIRFRLGSFNYVNYLEQKPNFRVKPF